MAHSLPLLRNRNCQRNQAPLYPRRGRSILAEGLGWQAAGRAPKIQVGAQQTHVIFGLWPTQVSLPPGAALSTWPDPQM